jgi:riboflavin synthase
MFTGLVQWMGTVERIERVGAGVRLVVAQGELASESKVGDSVAVNGCCLTVVAVDGASLGFDAGSETLGRTNLGRLTPGDRVNLEPSLRLGDALGGHWVTGHVDAVGTLASRHDDGDWSAFWFTAPWRLMRQMAEKGSIAVDGVSLTLVEVNDDRFSVALIPHTLQNTTLGALQVGGQVNLETDILAKYVERQLGRD